MASLTMTSAHPDTRLSSRQKEIAQLIADGLSSEEIAERLSLSEATVKTHVRLLRERLSARTRSHAVAIALRKGLIK